MSRAWVLIAIAAVACKSSSSGAPDGAPPGTPDAPAGTSDAAPGTPDGAPGTPDGTVSTPDAMPATPAVTSPGDPIGVGTATATIGAAGGTLTADFGRVTLTVPAGALAADTSITITPITNTAPSGLGNAYRLSPDGLVFATPATLTIAMTDEDQHSTDPDVLGVASQNADGTWTPHAVTADAAAHTVTASLPHFSDWSWFEHLSIVASKPAMFAGDTLTLLIFETEPIDQGNGLLLPTAYDYEGPVPATWQLVGNGTLTPSNHSASYTAAAPPSMAPILVTATMTLAGGPQVILYARVHVLAHRYRLAMHVDSSKNCTMVNGGSSVVAFDLTTDATMDFALDSSFQVSAPSLSAPVDATVTGLASCVPMSSASLGPGPSFGITATALTGGFVARRGRLALALDGYWSADPDFTMHDSGPPPSDDEHSALMEPLGLLAPFTQFQGGDGEVLDYPNATANSAIDFRFTLSVLQW